MWGECLEGVQDRFVGVETIVDHHIDLPSIEDCSNAFRRAGELIEDVGFNGRFLECSAPLKIGPMALEVRQVNIEPDDLAAGKQVGPHRKARSAQDTDL